MVRTENYFFLHGKKIVWGSQDDRLTRRIKRIQRCLFSLRLLATPSIRRGIVESCEASNRQVFLKINHAQTDLECFLNMPHHLIIEMRDFISQALFINRSNLLK